MQKDKFRQHFTSVLNFLIPFTKEYCFNNLSATYKFIITPNLREPDNHLNLQEVENLKALNKLRNKLLTADEVIDSLYKNDKVPLWINITVYESKPSLTVIDLFCSRRFRDDAELNYKTDQYPPFHPLVSIPPDPLKIEVEVKFDINWKKNLDARREDNIFRKLIRVLKS